MSRVFVLSHEQARSRAAAFMSSAPDGYVVTVKEPTRSLEQNALMWKLLQILADGLPWYGQKLSKEDWKSLITASIRKQRVVPGIDGGFVVVGESTSKMTKEELSEVIETIYQFGATHDVDFADDAP